MLCMRVIFRNGPRFGPPGTFFGRSGRRPMPSDIVAFQQNSSDGLSVLGLNVDLLGVVQHHVHVLVETLRPKDTQLSMGAADTDRPDHFSGRPFHHLEPAGLLQNRAGRAGPKNAPVGPDLRSSRHNTKLCVNFHFRRHFNFTVMFCAVIIISRALHLCINMCR